MRNAQKEMREINREYRCCKRNLAFCKRMNKKRARKERSEQIKAIRKVNRTYKRCSNHYFKTIKKDERTKYLVYKGKVKWCKKHFGESIENCKLCEESLEALGSSVLDRTLLVLGLLFSPITMIISIFTNIYDYITTTDNYISRHNIVK